MAKKSYLIGYDLNKPAQDYPDLIAAIKKIGLWWHSLDSTWIVKSDLTAAQICRRLGVYIDPDDELLVVALTGEATWVGFNEKSSAWLDEHLGG
jgi:hypothetical protein